MSASPAPALAPNERERLLAIAKDWRDTAEKWREYRLNGETKPRKDWQQPPVNRLARGQMHNWENWLLNCAQQIEDVLK